MPYSKAIWKAAAHVVAREYSLYQIWKCEGPHPGLDKHLEGATSLVGSSAVLHASEDPEVRATASLDGAQSRGYGIVRGGEVVAVCWFWWGERYRTRGFWELGEREAKLVQIVVAERFRGQRLGAALVEYASNQMFGEGFDCLYARIWHSHVASKRMFASAQWCPIAVVYTLTPRLWGRPLRWVRWLARAGRWTGESPAMPVA